MRMLRFWLVKPTPFIIRFRSRSLISRFFPAMRKLMDIAFVNDTDGINGTKGLHVESHLVETNIVCFSSLFI